ncbi:SusC/RagA family TonB-linked outer membrane protein [Bacteroides salyersiae]|uniref:SusC/RagA family TonB-linked outer membrane protein n=1 Tax=Bacteroides salyersiae TaxID=291644 RepID=UPI001C8BE877|nr:SusC/RagA family TonB-linked outer membrane protein [Bacteroides salyersiae]
MKKIYLNKRFALKPVGICLFMAICGSAVMAQEADSTAIAQTKVEQYNCIVKGRVVSSSTKENLAGARISVVDTRITTMTSDDGLFELRVPHANVTLYMDAPGYLPQVVSVKGRSDINIQLLEDTDAGNFYDKTVLATNKANIVTKVTPSITSIDQDFSNRLNGELRAVPHSGVMGNGSTVFIRGLNSLNMTAQPLYIVDGAIWQMQEGVSSIHAGFFNNPLALIDPNDVEDITVLKDGTSIYGSKGGNGVVIITTKRSKSMATDISAFMSLGYQEAYKTIPVMGAADYRLYASDVLSGMYSNSTLVDNLLFLDDDKTKSYYKANHNDTDWLKLINKGALSQNYGISVKGGDAIALYAFSVGYNKSDGNIENTDFNRLNVRFNSDINLTDKLKFLFDIAFAQSENHMRNDGIDEIASPSYLSLIKSPVYSPFQYNRDGSLSAKLSNVDELGIGNPLSLVDLSIGLSKKYRFNINALPTYSFTDRLKVGVMFNYTWDKLNEEYFKPSQGLAELPLVNEYGEIYAYSRNVVKNLMAKQTSIHLNAFVDWSPIRNSIHNLDMTGGYRFFTDNLESNYGEGHNTSSDRMNSLDNTTSSLRSTSGTSESWRSMSWYFNADYKYKNRYLLNVVAAMDASSRFGKQADGALKMGGLAWGVFPSVSAGWILSSEEFMKNVDFLNFLKLDASYGLSGNDDLKNYATRSYFNSVNFMGSANGLILANYKNDKLKWETTRKAKIGVDFSMFNNRWSVKADFFTSTTKDLLVPKQLPETSSLEYSLINDGKLKNKGFEIATNVRLLNLRNWKLDFGAMMGHYKNEIVSLAGGSYVTDFQGARILTAENSPAGVFYGYKTKGVFSTSEEAAAAGLNIRSESGALIPFSAGDMHFEEVIADHIINEKDQQVIGDPNPDLYGNFNFNLRYKNLTIETLFTYSYGNDAYNGLRANLEAGNNVYNQATSMQNRWVVNGQQTEIPRAVYKDPMGNSRFSDRWIEDASFMKFKTLSVSYKVPLNLSFLQEVTVWGTVNNLFTLTKYKGADPEFSYGNSVLYQGIDTGLTPQSRSYSIGVRINL